MTEIKRMHCLNHTGESSPIDDPRLRVGLSSLDEIENVLTLVVSDEALEIASGSNAEGVPTLAVGSYCLTCPAVFDEQ
jgi:hypothetical protein